MPAIITDDFSYKNLAKSLKTPFEDSLGNGHYSAFINVLNKDFFYVQRQMTTETTRRSADTGLKLHIAISPEHIDKGWEIVRAILMAENINYFKIIRPEHLEPGKNYMDDPGREITIYTFKEPDYALVAGKPDANHIIKFNRVISKITTQLAEAHILPGPKPIKDTAITGSNYVSWRNDNSNVALTVDYQVTVEKQITQPPRPKHPSVLQDEHPEPKRQRSNAFSENSSHKKKHTFGTTAASNFFATLFGRKQREDQQKADKSTLDRDSKGNEKRTLHK